MFAGAISKLVFRGLRAAAAGTVGLGSVAGAAPLAPTTPWNVDYTATSCDAKRRFGDVELTLSPAPLGATVRLVAEMRGAARRATQYPAVLDGPNGTELFTALVYPAEARGRRGIYAVLPKESFHRILQSGRLNFRAGTVARNGGIVAAIAGIDLDLGKTEGLVKALDTCLTDLQRHWGMVGGKFPQPAAPASPRKDQTPIFSSGDYPADAMRSGHTGRTHFLLMIDPEGKVMDCVIQQSSGIASLDAMGCQKMRERARFEPARDAAGKAVSGTYAMTIGWEIR